MPLAMIIIIVICAVVGGVFAAFVVRKGYYWNIVGDIFDYICFIFWGCVMGIMLGIFISMAAGLMH